MRLRSPIRTIQASDDSVLLRSEVLQRKSGCGNHTLGDERREFRTKRKGSLPRRAATPNERTKLPSTFHGTLHSLGQLFDKETPIPAQKQFVHDFTWVRAHADSQTATQRVLPAAPTPRKAQAPPPPGPLTKPGVADLYITVNSPAHITEQSIFTDDPFAAPSSGISFQLSRSAKFRQDEYIIGNLRWKSAASRVPESKQEEEYATFRHSWESETEKRPDLPGNPIMLKAFDSHTYGLSVSPGLFCEQAAKKHPSGFDRKNNDWSFTENAMFVDTVTFADAEVKRRYFFDFRCKKEGNKVEAGVQYSNVDKVEKS
jgi:hypothetical protein